MTDKLDENGVAECIGDKSKCQYCLKPRDKRDECIENGWQCEHFKIVMVPCVGAWCCTMDVFPCCIDTCAVDRKYCGGVFKAWMNTESGWYYSYIE